MNQREEFDALMDKLRAAPALPAGTTLLELRALADAMMEGYPVAPDLAFSDETLGGCTTIRARAPGSSPDRQVLLFHAGGYAMGSSRTHRAFSGDIARASGAEVIALDYRLAPEHVFPAAVDDCLAAYRELLERTGDASRIALCGDSAGGGLVIATMVAARDAGLPLPVAGATVSPWVDLSLTSPSMTRNVGSEPILTNDGLAKMAEAYLGWDTDPATPLASPIHADLRGLPPLLIEVGSGEILLDDSLALAARAAAAHVRVELKVRPHMFHGFHSRSSVLREAVDLVTSVGAFLDRRFAEGPSWECVK